MQATRHKHHFEDLSPDDFERLVYWLVRRSGEFDEVQWYGGVGDKGRDVVAYRRTDHRREKWYIQCKRYERIWFSTLRAELEKLAEHARDTPEFAPDVIVFATASRVPARVKDKARDYARELGLPEPYYWGRLELDERLKAQPETEEEFFLPTRLASPHAPVLPAETEVGALPEGMPHRMKIFLCHASGDKPAVRQLYHLLCGEGFDPWLDEERLLPGQDWELEIERALHTSDAVIVCLSPRAVTKRGYVQKEIRYALDVADEQPEGAIFLIPLRLEECEVPERLRRWQWVNLFEGKGYERLLRALRVRAESLGLGTHPFGPAGDRWRNPKDGKEMVRIPAGKFLYGYGKETRELPEFWIDQTPVTNAEYARFVAETGRKPPEHWEAKSPSEGIADHPVVNVSWHDATAYAKWAGERLLTEEEWEKAARGIDGRKYPWGDEKPTRHLCNFDGNEGGTTPVGKYSPQGDSPYECADMAGNVWEWTASDYDDKDKVLRGGSWCYGLGLVGGASRGRGRPDNGNDFRGFRCARGSE